MEQDHRGGEGGDPPVFEQFGDADGPSTLSPAIVSSSGEVVVDLRLADQEDGYGAGGGHAGDEEEHRTV